VDTGSRSIKDNTSNVVNGNSLVPTLVVLVVKCSLKIRFMTENCIIYPTMVRLWKKTNSESVRIELSGFILRSWRSSEINGFNLWTDNLFYRTTGPNYRINPAVLHHQ